jgi:hypothetical protein
MLYFAPLMSYAPIVVFVYNRAEVTLKTLESIARNREAAESEMIIFADGPKDTATSAQQQAIAEVRKAIRSKEWCKTITIVESPVNKGLANSVIDGSTQVINQYGRMIAVEDDVIVSPFFLQYMNEGLEKYQNEQRVITLGSWNYYYDNPPADTYFIRLPDTIAWASWKRAWDNFETDTQKIYQQLKDRNLLDKFNLDGRFPYENMIRQQLEGKVNSWAIRLTANALLNDQLSLYPAVSLSKHIGFGVDSTHVKTPDYNADLEVSSRPIVLNDIPLIDDEKAIDAFIDFELVRRPLITSRKKRIVHRVKKFLGWNRH